MICTPPIKRKEEGHPPVDFVEPLLDVVERLLVGDIVDDDDAVGSPVVRGSDRPEPLLSRGVPLPRKNAIYSGNPETCESEARPEKKTLRRETPRLVRVRPGRRKSHYVWKPRRTRRWRQAGEKNITYGDPEEREGTNRPEKTPLRMGVPINVRVPPGERNVTSDGPEIMKRRHSGNSEKRESDTGRRKKHYGNPLRPCTT